MKCMKNFIFNAFLCIVGINLITLSIVMDLSDFQNAGILFYLGILLAIEPFFAAIYHFYHWYKVK